MIVESWDGFRWLIESESDKVVLSKGELSVLRAFSTLPCDVFVDIGAHIGYYTVRLARKCREVIAFEPNPINRAKLLRNVELNGLTNVVVYPYACGEARYKAKLWLADTGSTLLEGYVRGESVEVDVVPVDDLVERADVVKVDVEGYEWRVVQGMSKLIDRCKPTLVIEHHDFRHYKISDYPKIRDFLRSRGYMELYLTTPHRLYYHTSRPLNTIKPLIATHWINHCVINLEQGRPWYYGLPYTWWWGMNLVDFIYEIENHVLRPDEPLWVELLMG
jgi:FkbM family methyltransferase